VHSKFTPPGICNTTSQQQLQQPTTVAMKHSKRESSSRGYKVFSKSPKDNLSVSHRLGPIIIEDILARATRMSKSDELIREMEVRTEPLNEASPRIKCKFRPLDNPPSVLEVSSSPSRETTSDVFRPTQSPQPTGEVHSTLHEKAAVGPYCSSILLERPPASFRMVRIRAFRTGNL
jgi:hypothetical protein